MEPFETGPARRLVLGAFCVAADIYLLGYALDSTLSVIDDFAAILAGRHIIGDIRNLVATIVFIASPILIFLCVFVPHLPKRVLLPPALFALWLGFGAPGVPEFADFNVPSPWSALCWSGMQMVFAVVAFATMRVRSGAWLLVPTMLPHKSHLILRTLAAFIFTIAVFTVLIGISCIAYVEETSGHFIDVNWSGIQTQERVLSKGNKSVHLIGMVHVGDEQFYERLISSFPDNCLVLTEGITDSEGRLKDDFSHSSVASALGLSAQPELGAEEYLDDVKDDPSPDPELNYEPRFVNADADVAEFLPKTISALNDLSQLYASRSSEELLRNFQRFEAHFEDGDPNFMFNDLTSKRNAKVIAAFDLLASDYAEIYIPWGAAHMPGLLTALKERGYSVTTTYHHRLVHFPLTDIFGIGDTP